MSRFPALVDRDDLEVPGQRRHQQTPGVPGLRPAVHQQQRRPVASDDRVLAQVTGLNVPAGERVGEPGWQVRRPGDRTGAFRGGRAGGSGGWPHPPAAQRGCGSSSSRAGDDGASREPVSGVGRRRL
jgi:hypothetical protein